MGPGGRRPPRPVRRTTRRRCRAEELWCTTGWDAPPVGAPRPSPVEIAGRVDDARLAQLYREAPCVVAPAYDEDYGLTAVEAMRFGTPVIVCRDGGGLAGIVRHGFDGLVVDPDAPSIAAAVDRICSDDEPPGDAQPRRGAPPRPRSHGGGPPTSSVPASQQALG